MCCEQNQSNDAKSLCISHFRTLNFSFSIEKAVRRFSLNDSKLQLILFGWIYDLSIGFHRSAIDGTSCTFLISETCMQSRSQSDNWGEGRILLHFSVLLYGQYLYLKHFHIR